MNTLKYLYIKEYLFVKYTKDDINLMINHINLVEKASLSGCNPYELMKLFKIEICLEKKLSNHNSYPKLIYK